MRETLSRHRQFFVYVAGGVASALIDVGLMLLLLQAGLPLLLATSVAFCAGLGFNFLFHAMLTFAAPPSGPRLARYLAVVALNYVFTIGCVGLAVLVGGAALAGKLVALPLVAVNGYLLGKRWIFQ